VAKKDFKTMLITIHPSQQPSTPTNSAHTTHPAKPHLQHNIATTMQPTVHCALKATSAALHSWKKNTMPATMHSWKNSTMPATMHSWKKNSQTTPYGKSQQQPAPHAPTGFRAGHQTPSIQSI
jgi:hypothetical protein